MTDDAFAHLLQRLARPDCTTAVSELFGSQPARRVGASELLQQIEQRTKQFKDIGIQAGQRVALTHGNSMSFLVDLFSVWSRGAIAIPLPPTATEHERHADLTRLRPHFILSPSALPTSTVDRHLEVAEDEIEILGLSHSVPSPALILLTSGSSAQPKAVLHSHRSLAARLASLDRGIPLQDRQETLAVLPTHFGHGLIGVVLSAIYSGAHLSLTPGLSIDRIRDLKSWMKASPHQFISATPGLWKLMMKSAPAPSSLRRIQVASAPSHVALWRDLWHWAMSGTNHGATSSGASVSLHHAYGLTETASWVSTQAWNPQDPTAPGVGDGQEFGSRFHLHQASQSENSAGEVMIESDALALGYVTLTTESQIAKPRLQLSHLPLRQISGTQRLAYATGDQGQWSSTGKLHLIGRAGRIINRGGLKVAPEEIELTLSERADLDGAVVLAIGENRDDVGLLISFKDAQLNPTERQTLAKEIHEDLRRRISREKLPSQIRYLSRLPLLANGKPDLRATQSNWESAEILWPARSS
ncbi:MAG TPA: class I adenylate-forming enzyme family protein [Pseudobdellovibrionaceae bacterium]|nr:class I adenylate-forming enzyme family protein [Pseudobdellovibrionaceae bacterium]